jgi:hypothetical protein
MILSLGGATLNKKYMADKEVLVFATGSPVLSTSDLGFQLQHTGIPTPVTEMIIAKFTDGMSDGLIDTKKFINQSFVADISATLTARAVFSSVDISIIKEPFSESIVDTSGLVLETPVHTEGEASLSSTLDGGGYGVYIKRLQSSFEDGLDTITIFAFE